MNSVESVELELTYLARSLPEALIPSEGSLLRDVYFPVNSAAHPHVRLRQKGSNYFITKKTMLESGDASQHLEQTISLSQEEFTDLVRGSDRSVDKIRFNVLIGRHAADVDVFTHGLEGLVLIDFEFDSVEEMNSFIPPDCCLVDVTQEDFIAGGLLAGKSYIDISDDLKRLNYVPISVSQLVDS